MEGFVQSLITKKIQVCSVDQGVDFALATYERKSQTLMGTALLSPAYSKLHLYEHESSLFDTVSICVNINYITREGLKHNKHLR